MPTTIFNPSLDGFAIRNAEVNWATLKSGEGTSASYNDVSSHQANFMVSGGATNIWGFLSRSFYLFDTSTIPANATITGATLSLYINSYADPSGAGWEFNVYSSNPTSDTALVAGDFSKVGSNSFATSIAMSSMSTSAYNTWTLNATGIEAINKTGLTKLSLRESKYDAGSSTPPWASSKTNYLTVSFNESDSKPKLSITYNLPSSGFFALLGGL